MSQLAKNPLPPRERLKESNASLEAAKAAAVNAHTLSEKAAAKLDSATDEYRNAQATQHKVQAFRVDAFRNGSSDELPQDLKDARAAGFLAHEDYQHAEALAKQMSDEAIAADSAVRSAELERESAVSSVLIDEARKIVARFEALTQQKQQLYEILRGTGNAIRAGDHAALVAATQSALEPRYESQLAYPPVLAGASRFWTTFRDALLADPDAPVPELPALDGMWQ